MSAARPGTASVAECEHALQAASVQVLLAFDADALDDDRAFDLREAAEVAEGLAHRAPSARLANELREAAAAARRQADPERAEPELAGRRVNLHAAIAAADVEPPWRCDRLAADGYLTVLAGRGGEGKSLLALALAGAVQHGSAVAGIDTRQGRVAIFDAENGAPLIGRRLRQAETPLDRLTVYEAAGLDLDRDRRDLEHAIRHDQANLVVFDSLRTLAPRAKENDSDDMAPIMGALRQLARDTGAAVLLLHHRDKALEHDFRGSGAIHDQADLVFVLDRDKDDDLRWRRRLRCAKCRIDAEPDDRWIGIKPWRGKITLTQAAAPEHRQRPAAVRDELADRILDVLRHADDPLTGAEVCRRLGRGKSDKTTRRALDALHLAEEIARDGDQRWTLPDGLSPGQATTPQLTTDQERRNPSNHAPQGVDTTPDDNPYNGRCHGAPPPEGGAPTTTPGDTLTPDQLAGELIGQLDAHEVQP